MQYYTETAAGALRDAVADAVGSWPAVTERVTFGCPAFYVDGTLFAVVSDQGLSLLRLDERSRDALAASWRVAPFRAGERSIEGWATVTARPGDLDALAASLRESYDRAREA